MQEELLTKILQRLNILISLELKPRYWEKETDQSKIEKLMSFGLKAGEIAEILEKPSDKVSKQLYVLKRVKGKGGKNDQKARQKA